MLPQLYLTPNFAVPIASCLHPDPQALNQSLLQLVMELERDPARNARATSSMQIYQGVFESNFQFFERPEACVRALRDHCWTTLLRVVSQANNYSPEVMAQIRLFGHSWFHITRRNGYFGMHNHPMASWSGVYCIDPGETPEQYPDSGVLQFHHPNLAAAMFEDPGNAELVRPYNFRNINYPLRAGLMVLFPSWLAHEVMPYFGERPRVTVAFNCWFQRQR